jgi:hypothetical protein
MPLQHDLKIFMDGGIKKNSAARMKYWNGDYEVNGEPLRPCSYRDAHYLLWDRKDEGRVHQITLTITS